MVAATRELKLKDIGRPRAVTIPIPEDGGVVLLTGENGVGKSTTLEAVQDGLTNRKDKRAKPRDGVASGFLNGCGIKMTVGRKITRTGELTVETLDGGRLSIADVVSPPYKGAEESDARRIKALVQLAGVIADPSLFAELLPNFADVVPVDDLNTDDILVMADQIKRKIEQEARNAEGRRDIEKQKALACEEAAKGISLDVETDAGVLQLRLEDAVRHGQELISKAKEAKARNSAIAEAKEKHRKATENYDVPSLDEAQKRKDVAERTVLADQDVVARLRGELQDAEQRLKTSSAELHNADAALVVARRFNATLDEWKATVDQGELTGPTEDELNAADESITAAREAIEAGAAARAAKAKLATAETHRAAEFAAETQVERYRTAASQVEQVLTDQIATLGSPLRVEAGRLVTDTDRGPTFFAELSDGERWRMATEIAVKAVGRGGLLTIPQAAFSELSPRNRQMIDDISREAGVVILSAIATNDPEIDAVSYQELAEVVL